MTQKIQCNGPPEFSSDLVSSGLIPGDILNSINYLPFKEARRRRLPIYKVLLTELYEEGCLVAAKYFGYLIEKESKLLKGNLINVTLNESYPKLLMRLFENVKSAETATIVDEEYGGVTCLKILYDSLILLEKYEDDLYWLLEDVYRIFVDLTETLLRCCCNFRCTPIIAKMYCKYGMFLARKGNFSNGSIINFESCRNLCSTRISR